jgi:hypothetical protein
MGIQEIFSCRIYSHKRKHYVIAHSHDDVYTTIDEKDNPSSCYTGFPWKRLRYTPNMYEKRLNPFPEFYNTHSLSPGNRKALELYLSRLIEVKFRFRFETGFGKFFHITQNPIDRYITERNRESSIYLCSFLCIYLFLWLNFSVYLMISLVCLDNTIWENERKYRINLHLQQEYVYQIKSCFISSTLWWVRQAGGNLFFRAYFFKKWALLKSLCRLSVRPSVCLLFFSRYST